MWTIEKKFSFCYGHRVWNQTLDMGLSITPECKCRHLHGHEGEVTVCLSSAALTDGMVTDFKHLNWFKQWLDNVLDHKFIIDAIDPLYDVIIQGRPSLDKMPEGHFIPVVPKGSLV